jgi:hypothetical protein
MAVIGGVITLVQEDRFKFAGDDGRKRQFTLFHRARIGIPGLQELERSRRHVKVRYRPAETLIADIAEAVDEEPAP